MMMSISSTVKSHTFTLPLVQANPILSSDPQKPVPTEAFPSVPNTLNWKNWHLKKAMPTLILPVAVTWGLGNVLEHQLHEGHLAHWKAPNWVKGGATKLAIAIPALMVAYGVFDAIGMSLAGYAWRTLGFALFGAVAASTLVPLTKANLWASNNPAVLQFLKEKGASLVKKGGLAKVAEAINEAGLKTAEGIALKNVTEADLKNWTEARTLHWATQATLIPFFFGLCQLSKVPQALPKEEGVTVQHTKGNTANELWGGSEPPPQQVFAKNFTTEVGSYAEVMSHIPKRLHQISTGLPLAFHAAKATSQPNESGNNQSALGRFMVEFEKTPTAALTYAVAATGYLVAGVTTVGLLLAGNKHLLHLPSDPFSPLAEAMANAKQPKSASESVAKTVHQAGQWILSSGQFTNALASLVTNFSDWPLAFSFVYRASAMPMLVGSVAHLFKWDKLIFTKLGGFMQTSAYALFLLVPAKQVASALQSPSKSTSSVTINKP
jgi:hypothetical protein